jgi:tetratricopeptide (TPR) repeat protein
MRRTTLAALAVALAAGARAAPAAPAPAPQGDPEAIREVQRAAGGRVASPRAIAHYLEARRAARAGDTARELEQLRLAVTYDEQSPELRVSLAEALVENGQADAAEGEAHRALALSAERETAADAHVLLGRIAATRRQRDVARRELTRAVAIERALTSADGEPPDARPWRILAALHLEAGDEPGAVAVLDDLATVLPGDGSAFRELGRIYLERHDAARAERHLRRAVQLAPRDVEALRLLAQVHEGLRREPDAKDDLLAILRTDPDDDRALLGLGRIAIHQGDLAGAREWFHRAARYAPDAADAHVRIVFQWLEAGHGPEALSAARAGIADVGGDPRLRFAEGLALQELRRWPESADALAAVKPEAGDLYFSARVALADALSRAGRHAEAEHALDHPLASRPRDVRLLVVRASVLDRAGRSLDSVALLRRTIAEREKGKSAADADLPELYVALADSLVRAGRPGEAVTVLRAALAPRPRAEELLYALGAAYERVGQADAAIGQMRALLALNPDHAEALNFLGYTLAEQGVRLDEAERLVRRALELKPRSGHMLDSLGWILFRRGETRQAVEALEKADELSGPDATILEHLGDAYRASARLADAAQAYRRALAGVGEELPADREKRRASIERKLREVSDRNARAERRAP